MTAPSSAFVRPKSLDEACALLAEHGAACALLAGGTDWVVEEHLAPQRAEPKTRKLIVDVSSLPELLSIDVRDGAIRLGAGVTYLTMRTDARISSALPILASMAKDVGALQIQARGTLAGNLATASPAADGVAALAALETTIGLRSVRGERSVRFDDYQLGYKKTARAADEVIAWIELRVPPAEHRWSWRKVGTRLAQAISKVALASVVALDAGVIQQARFGMASVAPVTALLPNVRRALEGRRASELELAAIDRAVDADIAPLDDVRSTADYRRHVARALVRGMVRSLA